MNTKTFVFLLLCVTGLLCIKIRQNEILSNYTNETSLDTERVRDTEPDRDRYNDTNIVRESDSNNNNDNDNNNIHQFT